MKINKPLSAALAAAGLGYAIGNLNPAYVMGLRKGYDIRKKGSGNAGATNLMILEGKKAVAVDRADRPDEEAAVNKYALVRRVEDDLHTPAGKAVNEKQPQKLREAITQKSSTFLFFRGALGHLRIRLSLVSRFGTLVETITATQPGSASLSFVVHPCREQACLFRLLRLCRY